MLIFRLGSGNVWEYDKRIISHYLLPNLCIFIEFDYKIPCDSFGKMKDLGDCLRAKGIA